MVSPSVLSSSVLGNMLVLVPIQKELLDIHIFQKEM